MIHRQFQFHAELRQFGRAICVYLFAPHGDGKTEVLTAMTMTTLPQDEELPVDTPIEISHKQAQQLMDELWRCGLRPSEGTGSAGSLAATEKHLKDMREIAMGLLRKEGVQV